jgi:adenylate kinase
MNVIILGAPGAGKGTQAAAIRGTHKLPHISTGDILRRNVADNTPIGAAAKSYMDKGELVPDEVIIELVRLRLNEPDCAEGYLLDGFPRSEAQARALDAITDIDRVINIDIDLGLLSDRLTGRRVCADCGESYHVSTYRGATCTRCKTGKLIQRPDDTEATVQKRLKVYAAQTEPLIRYYTEKGILVNVKGDQSREAVTAEVLAALKK